MENSVIDYLEKTAVNHPNKAACVYNRTAFTYSELRKLSRAVASEVLKICSPQSPVVIFMEKGCEALIGIWGVIYAGCCYVIIDPSLPTERICTVINTLESKCIVASTESIKKVHDLMFDGKTIEISSLLKKTNSPEEEKVLETIIEKICDIDPLYVMFTSGSTGIPKGVVVNHRSVIDFINHFTNLFQINADDIIGNQAPWDFDISVKDIFSAARTGATLEIIPKKKFSFPIELVDLLDERKVTTLIWAVSALCILSSRNAFKYRIPKFINKVIFSGEVMPINHFIEWRKAFPDAMFANVYGPTEITCNCLYYIVEKEFKEDVIPIGKHFNNERVFLLNEKGEEIEEDKSNQLGEICVSGSAVAMGYYNNREATDISFIQNPLNRKFREIIYCTGDLGYYNKGGLLCFSSRKDYQIKHMGHRIELEEIERSLNVVSGVNRACCLYEDNSIVCFYEGIITKKEIIQELSRVLPKYMIPAVFKCIEKMPITKNGKIDRKTLRDIFQREKGA